jgi:hypothetical protein
MKVLWLAGPLIATLEFIIGRQAPAGRNYSITKPSQPCFFQKGGLGYEKNYLAVDDGSSATWPHSDHVACGR